MGPPKSRLVDETSIFCTRLLTATWKFRQSLLNRTRETCTVITTGKPDRTSEIELNVDDYRGIRDDIRPCVR